jgi:two-component system, chemotaxis family, sensor kinase CheA
MGEVTPEQVRDVLQQQHNKRLQTAEAEAALDRSGSTGAKGLPAASPSHEIRVDGRKIERMALVIEQLMAMRLPGDQVSLLGELQSLVQSCRRDTLSSLVGRLQRAVHDLAIDANKRINFVVEGIEVLQEITEAVSFADSLLHLLRNGIEHGLESGEERLRAGKKKTGKLHLSAMRHGEDIWVSVEDDGRGFDFDKVTAMLVNRGLVTAESAGLLTSRERLELLFRGSSPPEDAEQAAANRGGGLALVHGMLLEMKGKITVTTRSGKGSCVTLRVPRTP